MKWKLGDAKWREAERHDAEKCETERRKMEHCEAELYDAERRKMKNLMQTNDLMKMPCLLNRSVYQLCVSALIPPNDHQKSHRIYENHSSPRRDIPMINYEAKPEKHI